MLDLKHFSCYDPIHILVTGGTFNKIYDGVDQKMVFTSSHIHEILNDGRSTLNIRVDDLMMKDSLDITDKDIEFIVSCCNEVDANRIIIIYGTDNMCKHAEIMAKKIDPKKTVVFTGAIIPYKCSNSDAQFNLGCAISFVQFLEKGVYVVMNGKCHMYDNVQKDYNTGYFDCKK